MRRVRLTDPETSRQAAASVAHLRTSQRIILEALDRFGEMTDEEIYNFISGFHQISVSGARTRRKELVDQGLVRDSGRRGTTKSGRKTILWEVTDDAKTTKPDRREVDAGRRSLDRRGPRDRAPLEAGEDGDVHPSPDLGAQRNDPSARQRRIQLPR